MQKLLLLVVSLFLVSCGKSINSEKTTFKVQKGESIHKVASNLKQQSIITDPLLFRILARLTGKDQEIKFGEYEIPVQSSYSKILKIVTSGKGNVLSITIKEGLNVFEIAALLEDKGIISAKEFFVEVSDKKWFRDLGIPVLASKPIEKIYRFSDLNGNKYAAPFPAPPMIEGYLFPDTYHFQLNMNPHDVVKIMVNRFKDVIKSEKFDKKAENTGISLHKLLIFASIIQKEASSIEEMPKVAGVYSNRIFQNMRLQADPTLIYALILDNEYRGNIKTRHLRPPWQSSYNTYARRGLPPYPIANPGKNAIAASLKPIMHNYIYFVRDPEGFHTYSSNLEDHNKAVRKWVNHKRGG
ncbi:MAG: endolytic transglycosylase MltG [Brevinema sp.]